MALATGIASGGQYPINKNLKLNSTNYLTMIFLDTFPFELLISSK